MTPPAERAGGAPGRVSWPGDPRAIDAAVRRLERAGVAGARHDARALHARAAGDPDVFARYVERRASREPLQHIAGSVGFRWVELAVGPGVFVPRPETEVVAGAAIDAARRVEGRPAVVVDLCAGSGAIALSVAREVPGAAVHAVEVDAAALEWLRRNAAGTPVTVCHGRAADALPHLDGRVDVVASNPPYLTDAEVAAAEPEVRDHDPRLALAGGGPDGLDAIAEVAAVAARLLRPGGVLVVEHGDRQGGSVPALLRRSGDWTGVAAHEDLAGRPRYATARRA